MPKRKYIVIILDVNSIPRESPFTDEHIASTSLLDNSLDDVLSTSGGSHPEIKNAPIIPYKYQAVKATKEMVISHLAYEALQYHNEEFDFAHVFWSFKLFNSSYEINSKTGRTFQPISMESIDAFEKQLDSYLDTGSQSALKSSPFVNKIQFLSTSLKSVLGDLPWPDSRNDFGNDLTESNDNHNVIYAMFRVPGSEGEIQAFIPNWTPTGGSKTVMNELLPKAFCRKLKDHQIKLNVTDMWPAFDVKHASAWETEGSGPMTKIVHFLGGKISPFAEISSGVPFGLPSYATLLKLLITEYESNQTSGDILNTSRSKKNLEETQKCQKTIRKLHDNINGSFTSIKISAMDDTDIESLRSASVTRAIPISNPSYALAKLQRRSFPSETLPQRRHVMENERYLDYLGGGYRSVIRRFSDERLEREPNRPIYRLPPPYDEGSMKRKYEFEEDMESEEGYSPTDIENWCITGKIGVKDKQRQLRRQAVKGSRRRIVESVAPSDSLSQRYTHQYHSIYRSPQLFQPQKRIRRDPHEEEEFLGLPPRSHDSTRPSARNASFLSVNNPKRTLMLPVSKPPMAKPKIYQKHQSQSTQSGSQKPPAKSPKPKKVRRNLFDVQTSRDPKDMKMLLNLATNNSSSFSRSPSLFKSPHSKLSMSPRSPGRPSPFFQMARARKQYSQTQSRSRRKLNMDLDDEESRERQSGSGKFRGSSHSPHESLLCPESPFTPKSKGRVTPSGSKHSSNYTGKSVVAESPEVPIGKSGHLGLGNRSSSSRMVGPVSFYSSGNESLKARAWERSGAKLLAAKIKDTVDMSQSFCLNDFEFFVDDNLTPNTGDKKDNENKTIATGKSPAPCSSKTISQHIEVASLANVNSNIKALISSELVSSPTKILNSSATLSSKSPGMETPSKRVQFSLELVSTPSPTTPARLGGTPVTPKSILKDGANVQHALVD